jgi:hypothetical protein
MKKLQTTVEYIASEASIGFAKYKSLRNEFHKLLDNEETDDNQRKAKELLTNIQITFIDISSVIDLILSNYKMVLEINNNHTGFIKSLKELYPNYRTVKYGKEENGTNREAN